MIDSNHIKVSDGLFEGRPILISRLHCGFHFNIAVSGYRCLLKFELIILPFDPAGRIKE